MEKRHSTISVCVPTARRANLVDRLLQSLISQRLMPDEILIIDASPDQETELLTAGWQDRFPDGVLRYLHSELGLTRQRNMGIDHTSGSLVCMLDDDVILEPDCLERLVRFMDSEAGQEFGGVSAYITNQYGRDFYKIERTYHRLGIFERLEPGLWLYNGDFLDLTALKPMQGVYRTDFIPGGTVVWRRQVFENIRPDSRFQFGGEDKHLSLRVSQKWAVGVLGSACLQHIPARSGVRKPAFVQGRITMRNKAIILVECDPNPTNRRYTAFILYNYLSLLVATGLFIINHRWEGFPGLAGSWIGHILNTLNPPTRSRKI